MSKIKICFLSKHFKSPGVFLNTIVKMTPKCSGKWKNIEAIIDSNKADFSIICDGYNEEYPRDRAIYFGQHPYVKDFSPSFHTYQDKGSGAIKMSLDKYFNAGEWWIEHTYDELMALEPPKKTKKLACIMTYQTHNPMYVQRIKFMQEFTKQYQDYDLYGRKEERFLQDIILPKVYRGTVGHKTPDGLLGQHTIGKEILLDYKYSLEYDVGPTKNYISERFYDALLLWTMPIYFGSNNVHEIIPKGAFHYVDIYNLSEIKKVIDIINSDSREQNIEAIREARDLLLNKYQTWAYVHEVVNNLDKYKEK